MSPEKIILRLFALNGQRKSDMRVEKLIGVKIEADLGLINQRSWPPKEIKSWRKVSKLL